MGGLSGRVDQTVHVMSLLHKLRKSRPRSFILSSESLAWVLDGVSQFCRSSDGLTLQGSHIIEIDHLTMGQTCGILPVGIDSAYVKTEGLKWNLGRCIPMYVYMANPQIGIHRSMAISRAPTTSYHLSPSYISRPTDRFYGVSRSSRTCHHYQRKTVRSVNRRLGGRHPGRTRYLRQSVI